MSLSDYSQIYTDAGNQYGIDPHLLMAQGYAEDASGDPNAVGSDTKYGNAQGVSQLLPSTAKSLGVSDPKDPKQAIFGQAKLMAENLQRYGNITDAVSAYHGGTDQSNWGPKTKAYTQKVLGNYQQLAENQKMDPIEAALSDQSSESAPSQQHASVDPIVAALSDNSDNKTQTPPPQDSTWDKVGKAAEYTAHKLDPIVRGTFDPIGRGVQNLGAEMTPMKMAMIVPSMAIAPAASALAETSSAIPFLSGATRLLAGEAAPGAGLVGSLGAKAVGGAAQGAAANMLMGGDASSGAATGAVLNPALSAAGKVAGPLYNAVTGYGANMSPEVAQLAKDASAKYGVDIPGGLLTNNSGVKKVYSLMDRFGLTPQTNNVANFTQAASKEFGENTPKLTRAAMDTAENNIGNRFNNVWNSTPGLDITKGGQNSALNELSRISNESKLVLPDSDTRIQKQIDNIIDIASKNNNVIPSQIAQFLVSTKSPLHKLTKLDPDPAADYASDIKNALYDSLGHNAPPGVQQDYSKAKQYYKNFKTVEAANPNPITGELAPTSLANAVSKTANKYGTNGIQNLQELGDIGKQFQLSPSSGTAENYITAQGMHFLGNMAAGGAGYAFGGLPAAAGTYIGGKAVGSYLSSDMYKNHLIQSALGRVANTSPNLWQLLTSSNKTPMSSELLSNTLIGGNQARQ